MTADHKRENAPPNAAAAVPALVPVAVYATFPSLESAKQAGSRLVERRLAACVNIIPGMIAIYEWQGARQEDSEVVLIAKTRGSLVAALTACIRETHPYTNPAIVSWPLTGGSEDYLAWVLAETTHPA